jgi:AhpD family alkylhydroperoxidase
MSSPTPIDVLRSVSPEGATSFMEHRAAVMDNPQLQAIPAKDKLLVGVAVAAALQSTSCTLRWTMQAKGAGASDGEIAEAILVARLVKMATINATATEALAWLESQQ